MNGRLTLFVLLAACSDVQSVQLGEPAGTRSPSRDAGPLPLVPSDSGPDAARLDASTRDSAQPETKDAAAPTPDARIDDKDVDDDDDEGTEESPRDDDAGKSGGD